MRTRARRAGPNWALAFGVAFAGCSGADPTPADGGGWVDADVADGGPPTDSGGFDVGAADAEPADLGVADGGHSDATTRDAAPPDMGVPDAEPSDAAPPDAGFADAAPPDAGFADAAPPDAGFADAAAPDAAPLDAGFLDAEPADLGLLDVGSPDASHPDVGFPDAGAVDAGDAGPVDGGPPAGYYRVTIVGNAQVVFLQGNSWGTCIPTAGGACSFYVEPNAYITVGQAGVGHCFDSATWVVCGGSTPLCFGPMPPAYFGSECSVSVTSNVVFAHSDFYDGALSVCSPAPTTCPSAMECGRIGTTSCGACPAGEVCTVDGYTSACVPASCN